MDLYKILSLKNWQKSQTQKYLILSEADKEFIHFSTKDQLERILNKYWSDGSEYVILQIDSAKLLGRLVFEANPGGENKYYHLYEGAILVQSVIVCE